MLHRKISAQSGRTMGGYFFVLELRLPNM
jgi:hypothetical protein